MYRGAGLRPPPRSAAALIACAVASACLSTHARAQTSLTGGSLAIKTGTTTLSATGYVGTYLVVPSGGATINFTLNATASTGATTAPHMNLVIGDTLSGFSVANITATNYTTPNITLPAGTYFVRDERDYSGNVGVTRSF